MSGAKFFIVGESTSIHISAESAWDTWKLDDETSNPQWTLKACTLRDGELSVDTEIWAHDTANCEKFYSDVILPARLAALKKESEEIQRKIVAVESELAASQLWP
jgi:hypothetical protein